MKLSAIALKNLKRNFSFYFLYLFSVSFVLMIYFCFTSFSMNQIIMETLMDDQLDADGLGKAANAVATLQRAQVQNEKLKMASRKEAGAVHTAMNILKDKVFMEIAEKHPDVANILLQLAEQTEEEMEKMK